MFVCLDMCAKRVTKGTELVNRMLSKYHSGNLVIEINDPLPVEILI